MISISSLFEEDESETAAVSKYIKIKNNKVYLYINNKKDVVDGLKFVKYIVTNYDKIINDVCNYIFTEKSYPKWSKFDKKEGGKVNRWPIKLYEDRTGKKVTFDMLKKTIYLMGISYWNYEKELSFCCKRDEKGYDYFYGHIADVNFLDNCNIDTTKSIRYEG